MWGAAKDSKVIKILLVEDNLDDVAIAKRALKKAEIINQLWVVRDGQEALDFFYKKGPYKDEEFQKPGLILLDINLPKLSGLEVLKEIKQNDQFKQIPIVMLTVSKRDEDVFKGYTYGCNSFIQKPVEFERFVDVIKQIGVYWGELNMELPRAET
ncbi:MAG: response regulator [PVC group bacterium]|nr:response regulator [PVC group bacterium]